ncbi:SPFH domain-containing protein [uncultured Thiodictyon sp.]|jgi:regulator of protease activity HflC (stomatin/prohibitin superfamily)|uniref:SPFH domain-containing protein n=1 Tax=uncultured Thiodictyon sp. TaxID=1846217 RepID=UPI0025FFFAD5|nr:SPFH domain-containing protein [uncultured Thiodictyon sp.]
MLLTAFLSGLALYSIYRVVIRAFYTVKPNERAVLTSFGRAQRFGDQRVEDPRMTEEERARYRFPRLQVIGPGGPYFKWPWQEVHKVDVATQALDLTWDPTKRQDTIEAVTKDNLTTGVNGQVRFRVAEDNLYPFVFGVADPLQHVMGYFISVLRERIANFSDPKGQGLLSLAPADAQTAPAPASEALGDGAGPDLSEGVSINDLRKNLPLLNAFMEQQCLTTGSRYGIELEAALITQIDPPLEVDRALSAINSTRNQVAADISTARADAEQQITMSKRAVDIATNTAQAEVAPLKELAQTLVGIKGEGGSAALAAYVRNMRIPLLKRARRIVQTTGNLTPNRT